MQCAPILDRTPPFSLNLQPTSTTSKNHQQVNPTLRQPLRLLAACCAVDTLLLLLALLTPTAFYITTSLSTAAVQLSYAIPCLQRVTAARRSFEP